MPRNSTIEKEANAMKLKTNLKAGFGFCIVPGG